MRITDKYVKSISKPCFTNIDDNLFLKAYLMKGKLYKRYVLRYQLNGKRIDKSLGSINMLTLKQAKEKCRRLLVEMSDKQIALVITLTKSKQKNGNVHTKKLEPGITD